MAIPVVRCADIDVNDDQDIAQGRLSDGHRHRLDARTRTGRLYMGPVRYWAGAGHRNDVVIPRRARAAELSREIGSHEGAHAPEGGAVGHLQQALEDL